MKSSYQVDWRKLFLTILRMAIGWHFLYEGVIKIVSTGWTSYNYLMNTSGFFSPFYHWLASSPAFLKTMHHDRYWSANNREDRVMFYEDQYYGKDKPKSYRHDDFHDNIWDQFPERTIGFIRNSKVPVIGFKVLAAGAIPPNDGFRYAFENGAYFICTGMFDFQIVNDINICIDTLNNLKDREREWYA